LYKKLRYKQRKVQFLLRIYTDKIDSHIISLQAIMS